MIVGSGAAGLLSGIIASGSPSPPTPPFLCQRDYHSYLLYLRKNSDNNLSSVVLEKESKWGGTSSYSGGGVWIPNNYFLKVRTIIKFLSKELLIIY